MATTTTKRARPVRTLVILGILIIAIFGTLFAGTKTDPRSDANASGAAMTPALALDLEGGTQIILKPVTTTGQKVTSEDINQAISVIRQRIDSSGVSEAEIQSQGNNIIVGIPGQASQATIDLISESAQMTFRPVLAVGAAAPVTPTASPTGTGTPGATGTATPSPSAPTAPASTSTSGGSGVGVSQSGAKTATGTASPSPAATTPASTDGSTSSSSSDPSSLSQITPAVEKQFASLDCTKKSNLKGGDSGPTNAPFVACAQDGSYKYILGPVEVQGTDIKSATSGLKQTSAGTTTNEWVVDMTFDKKGTKEFADATKRITPLESPRNQFAIVLDGLVVSAPVSNEAITNGRAEISGNFTRQSAATLANQLNFGALPLNFTVQSQEEISATLGSEQLSKGLMAGLIGLLLVVIYSLFQYRALGFVTVASLTVAAVVTYGVITLLSWTYGYRLSLPGVAGLIVSIGITADSFIVYFERIRDQLRDGRSLPTAVDNGWARARRTILASDTVNFLAAVVLYVLAVSDVRGFAFTLGLTTLVDLVVVFFFTHPVMMLLAKRPFFAEGHHFSGLDPRRLGVDLARYAGRGRVITASAAAAGAGGGTVTVEDEPASDAQKPKVKRPPVSTTSSPPRREDGSRMTIAERRAAERAAGKQAAETKESASVATDEPAGDVREEDH